MTKYHHIREKSQSVSVLNQLRGFLLVNRIILKVNMHNISMLINISSSKLPSKWNEGDIVEQRATLAYDRVWFLSIEENKNSSFMDAVKPPPKSTTPFHIVHMIGLFKAVDSLFHISNFLLQDPLLFLQFVNLILQAFNLELQPLDRRQPYQRKRKRKKKKTFGMM